MTTATEYWMNAETLLPQSTESPTVDPPSAPETSTSEWVLVDRTWYEIGQPIPSTPSKSAGVLGRKVIAQSVDGSGQPLQRVEAISMLNPEHDQQRWSKMSAHKVRADIAARQKTAERAGPTAVNPLVGILAIAGSRLRIERHNQPPFITGEHNTAPGRPSHRVHEVIAEFSHQKLLTLLALQIDPAN